MAFSIMRGNSWRSSMDSEKLFNFSCSDLGRFSPGIIFRSRLLVGSRRRHISVANRVQRLSFLLPRIDQNRVKTRPLYGRKLTLEMGSRSKPQGLSSFQRTGPHTPQSEAKKGRFVVRTYALWTPCRVHDAARRSAGPRERSWSQHRW
jgi:hypothetical protein